MTYFLSFKYKTLEITKIDAARNQLNIAIYLYFNDMDLVSCHSLVWAARTIVFDLSKAKNIKEKPIDFIEKSYREIYEVHLRKAQNFFKHAAERWDDKKVFELDENLTQTLMYDAIVMYNSLWNDLTKHMIIFLSYYYSIHKNDLKNQKIKSIVDKITSKLKNISSKKDYYNMILAKK